MVDKMETSTGKISYKRIFQFTGAIIAFLIGSGFASGQEVLQFLASYGIKGIIGGVVSMILFAILCAVLMKFGFNNKHNPKADGFRYYCGRVIGTFMKWYTPFFCFLIGIVMISGAGATMNQYFGIPTMAGTIIMSVIVFVTTMFGFKRLVDIISYLGPLTIIFTILIGFISIIKHPVNLMHADAIIKATPNLPFGAGNSSNFWLLAAILYVGYNVVAGVPFMTVLGKDAKFKREAVISGVLAGFFLMAAAIMLDLAVMGQFKSIVHVEVPILYLANEISPILSAIFTFILLEEIFSTAAPMVWTVTYTFIGRDATPRKYRWFIFVLTVITAVGAQMPFGQLVGIVYPMTGYLGIAVLVAIISREIYDQIKARRVKTVVPEDTDTDAATGEEVI